MSTFTADMLYVLSAVLLPIIPAFVFYKMLPSVTGVSGTLRRNVLKLSGAFASYFLLAVFILLAPRAKPVFLEPWTVTGKIILDPPLHHLDDLVFSVNPPPVYLLPDGTFSATFVARNVNGKPNFPVIQFTRNPTMKFEPVTIRLDTGWYGGNERYNPIFDVKNHSIKILEPIRIPLVPDLYPVPIAMPTAEHKPGP